MKKITLVQKVADNMETKIILENSSLPLVIHAKDSSFLDLITKIEKEILNSSNLLNEENPSTDLYYKKEIEEDENYYFLNPRGLRKIIEKRWIQLDELIDYNGNCRYIDYIYPSSQNRYGGGIVFRNKLRIFGNKKDYYYIKLVREYFIKSLAETHSLIDIYFPLTSDKRIEMIDLCNEAVDIYKNSISKEITFKN